MDERMFNDFLVGKWKWVLYVIKAYLIHDLCFVHVVEAFITLNWRALYKYINPFSNMPVVHIQLFFSINFLYAGDYFIVTHAHILVSNKESTPMGNGSQTVEIPEQFQCLKSPRIVQDKPWYSTTPWVKQFLEPFAPWIRINKKTTNIMQSNVNMSPLALPCWRTLLVQGGVYCMPCGGWALAFLPT